MMEPLCQLEMEQEMPDAFKKKPGHGYHALGNEESIQNAYYVYIDCISIIL